MRRMFRTVMLGNGSEVHRNEILETLSRKIAELEEENALLRLDLIKTIESCNDHIVEVDHGATEISQLRGEIMTLLAKMSIEKPQRPIQENEVFLNDTPFVVVLIDGSASMLEDSDVQHGERGGRRAVKRFYDHLIQYLVERQVFQIHWRLIIKFYASMSSLGTTYLKSNTINSLETWRGFINGFNNEYPLCYFIDAGDDQTTTGHNIQNQLTLFFGHHDCKHPVLIGTSDGSYTGFLRQYMKSDDLCGRITVIEAIPFPGELHDLSSRFLPNRKDALFPTPADTNSCTPLTSPKRAMVPPTRQIPTKPNISPDSFTSPTPSPKRKIKARPRPILSLPSPGLEISASPDSSASLKRSIKSLPRTVTSPPNSTTLSAPSSAPIRRRDLPNKSVTRTILSLPTSTVDTMPIPTSTRRRAISIRSPIRTTSIIPSSSLNPFPSPSPRPTARTLFDSAASRLQPLAQTQSQPPTPSSYSHTTSARSPSMSSSLQIPIPTLATSNSRARSGSKSKSRPKPKPRPRSQVTPTTPLRDPSPSPSPIPRSGQSQTRMPYQTTSKDTNTSASKSVIRRKPLAETQTRLPLPRPRNTFFDSKGQRVDSKAYVSVYTQRYLDC